MIAAQFRGRDAPIKVAAAESILNAAGGNRDVARHQLTQRNEFGRTIAQELQGAKNKLTRRVMRTIDAGVRRKKTRGEISREVSEIVANNWEAKRVIAWHAARTANLAEVVKMNAQGIKNILIQQSPSHPKKDRCDSHFGVHRLPYPLPPYHPFCLLGNVPVLTPEVYATSARWYRGAIVEFETERGSFLSVTPNHPVLTAQGFIEAGFLKKGQNVIRALSPQRFIGLINPNHNQVPTIIQDVVSAFAKQFGVLSRCVPTAAEDFNGDWLNGEINVICANRLLQDGGFASSFQESGEASFVFRDSIAARLIRESALMQSFFAGNRTSASVVRGLGLSFSGLGRQLGNVKPSSIANATNSDPALAQELSNWITSYPALIGELLDRFSRLIVTDKIIRVGKFDFRGQVFNLQTSTEFYLADGIITHNCTCLVAEVGEMNL